MLNHGKRIKKEDQAVLLSFELARIPPFLLDTEREETLRERKANMLSFVS
jgi:hypothetical protein